MPPKQIILTVDVEDWFQVENLRPEFPIFRWNNQPLRVESNTHRLLDLFDSFSSPVKATFFILGWVAENCRQLVRDIQNRGHEIASHGYRHSLCPQLNATELYQDLVRSKKLLEDISGEAVHGYRAPNFSISDEVLAVVKACGYRYDSSYNSFSKNHRYGKISIDGKKRHGLALELADDFYELPISNLSMAGQTLPWGGGGYFRFLPPPIFRAGVDRILKKSDAYLFYMHPWEIDPGQPKARTVTGLNKWRHYVNLEKTHDRLATFIETYFRLGYSTCHRYLEEQKNRGPSMFPATG
ncbi:MAG: polysaccharide deacetylase family protein [Thermodesulfobacteriota bacterium]